MEKPGKTAAEAREAKLAAALRANLRRRKSAGRVAPPAKPQEPEIPS